MCCLGVCRCYLEGVRDGFHLGVRRGYRAGYIDGVVDTNRYFEPPLVRELPFVDYHDQAKKYLEPPIVRELPFVDYYEPPKPYQHQRYDELLRPPCYCRGNCVCGRR